ncbi:MAG: DUF364 domain-containing protein [Candidatus Hadarchaeales archaeon]
MIVEELLKFAEPRLRRRTAKDVRIGLSYTGVLLDDDSLGLAYSFREEAAQCCSLLERAGELEGDAWELAGLSLAPDAVGSSVGVATVNAAINRDARGKEGDALKFLDLKEGDEIGMVGDFKPMAEELKGRGHKLYVFERSPKREGVLPDWAAEYILPKLSVVLITGTAVINKTIDHLLELARNAREIAVLGPSTPLAGEVFKKHGVTLLSGMVVEEPRKALRIISQGGGARELKRVARKVTLDLR